jgi:hypothetical protein
LQPVEQALGSFSRILGILYNMMFVLAIIAFVGGVAWFIYKKARGEEVEKSFLLWGIVGLAVIFSIYGLIKVLQSVVGVSGNENVQPPRLPNAAGTPVLRTR